MGIKSNHLASHVILGPVSGKRIGVRYLRTIEEVRQGRTKPGFRWRNEEMRQVYLAAAKPEPR